MSNRVQGSYHPGTITVNQPRLMYCPTTHDGPLRLRGVPPGSGLRGWPVQGDQAMARSAMIPGSPSLEANAASSGDHTNARPPSPGSTNDNDPLDPCGSPLNRPTVKSMMITSPCWGSSPRPQIWIPIHPRHEDPPDHGLCVFHDSRKTPQIQIGSTNIILLARRAYLN